MCRCVSSFAQFCWQYRAQRYANVLIVVLRYGASVWTGVELFFNKHKDIAMSVWENNRPEAVLSDLGSVRFQGLVEEAR